MRAALRENQQSSIVGKATGFVRATHMHRLTCGITSTPLSISCRQFLGHLESCQVRRTRTDAKAPLSLLDICRSRMTNSTTFALCRFEIKSQIRYGRRLKKHFGLDKRVLRINIVDDTQYLSTLMAENYSKNNVQDVDDMLCVRKYIL